MALESPRALRDLAMALALEAGAIIEAARGRLLEVEVKGEPTDLVTQVDRAVEAHIVKGLAAERSADGILGEEGTSGGGSSGVRWIIDPIDGTTNFVRGIPAYAVSIGVEVDGAGVAGAVYDAAHHELFSAALGEGAHLDGQPIAVSAATELTTAVIATGFAYDRAVRALQGPPLSHLVPRVGNLRRTGAAAIDLCWVACGRVDGYYEAGLQPWDTAAGEVIIREAGGALEWLPGVPRTLVAAGPGLLEPLRRALLEASDGGVPR